MYDEIEYFTQATKPYPFKQRRSNIPLNMRLPFQVEGGKKAYTVFNMYLKKNVVCYDNDIFSQILFWKESKCDLENTSNFDFQKIQLSKFSSEIGLSSD